MNDITDRLRHDDSMNPDRDDYRHEVLGRAATEIESLRSELARLKEAAELLTHAYLTSLYLRSIEDGLVSKVLSVSPLDPKHPTREALRNYGMAQLDCAVAEEAVDANPTASALVEKARKEKA